MPKARTRSSAVGVTAAHDGNRSDSGGDQAVDCVRIKATQRSGNESGARLTRQGDGEQVDDVNTAAHDCDGVLAAIEVHDEPGLPWCTVGGAQDRQLHGFLAQLSRGGRSSFGSLVAAAPDRMPARITAPSNASAVMTRPASGGGTRITTP